MLFQAMNVLFNCALLHSGDLTKHSSAERITISACGITRRCKIWPSLQVQKYYDMLKFGALFFICIKINLVKVIIAQLV
jgi:hypothetical protein